MKKRTNGDKSKHQKERAKNNKRTGNQAERKACKWALEYTSGLHPEVKDIATTTGRVGNYANLEIDGVFTEYSLESKSRKKLPKWLVHGLVDQAVKASKKFHNNPLLVLRSSGLPKGYRVWHLITPERHAELMECERKINGKIEE
jgi:hypothetical protein